MTTRPCSEPEFSQFDFWLGEWDLTWPAEQAGGKEGDVGTGTNHIDHLFDPCVIRESFATSDGSFLGHSVSTYDTNEGVWRQTWVDNTGGYLVFTGEFADGQMTLRTARRKKEDGEVVQQRMVFRDITADSLKWDWQGSRDGGATWADLWNIAYTRRR